MTYIKRYLKYILTTTLSILILLFLLTIIYYFNLIKPNTFNLLKLLIILLTILINSLLLGKESNKKGYLEGIKLGSLIVILIFILTIIFSKFEFKNLIYYLLILITSTLGSMIGINKKKTK